MAAVLGHWGLARLTDPLGLTLIGELSKVWTPGEKNALVVGPQTSVLLNRLAWLGVALGVLALYAVREYVGAERVDAALRRFFERHGSVTPPLPTTLDLYRELQAVTPEELRYLLADMFEANTYWELAAKRVEAERVGAGEWRVTLDVRARKVSVDEEGVETEVPMDDLVEIGVFAAAGDGGAPPYLRMHRVRSGEQRIALTVPWEPARAGIDPRNLLIDVEPGDNFAATTTHTRVGSGGLASGGSLIRPSSTVASNKTPRYTTTFRR